MDNQTVAINPHTWVKNHADYLYAYAMTRLNDEDLAKDLVQETFLAALQKVDGFEGKSTERTWLTAILKYKIIDIYRKRSSGLSKISLSQAEQEQQQFFDPDNGHWTAEHAPAPFTGDAHDPLQQKEFNRILQFCMQKLPPLWLSVFSMKHLDDAESDLICQELRITPSNFWVIIHRAKLSLRACLQKNWI